MAPERQRCFRCHKPHFALPSVQDTNAGNYTVVVTEFFRFVTSSVARLDILPSFSKTTLNGGNYYGGAAWVDYDGDGTWTWS